jgi:hypothetical protein
MGGNMSKVADYTQQGYLKPDPLDASRSIFTIEMSIANALIEMGALESVGAAKGITEGDIPAQLIAWVKNDAAQAVIRMAMAEAEAQAREAVIQQVGGLI